MILQIHRIVIGAIVATSIVVHVRPLCAAETPVTLTVTIDPTVVVATVPADFVGLGYETCAVAQPDYFSAKNTRLIKLYGNLAPHGMIRIGETAMIVWRSTLMSPRPSRIGVAAERSSDMRCASGRGPL